MNEARPLAKNCGLLQWRTPRRILQFLPLFNLHHLNKRIGKNLKVQSRLMLKKSQFSISFMNQENLRSTTRTTFKNPNFQSLCELQKKKKKKKNESGAYD